jgi:hypothetical protein
MPIREAAMRPQALAHAIPVDQVDLEALDRARIVRSIQSNPVGGD